MGWLDFFVLLEMWEELVWFTINTFCFRFLLGRHKLAVEAYLQAEAKCDKPDWEIHHNLGNFFVKNFKLSICFALFYFSSL